MPFAERATLRRNIVVGALLTSTFLGFDLVALRTNWLLPRPLFCGEVIGGKLWRPLLPQARAVAPQSPGRQLVCVHEVIKPYSMLAGSADVALAVHQGDGSTDVYDTQLFIAKQFGPEAFNDRPGDWIFYSHARYAANGLLRQRSYDSVASWDSDFFNLPVRQGIWRMVQDALVDHGHQQSLSWHRPVVLFVAHHGIVVLVLLLLVLLASDRLTRAAGDRAGVAERLMWLRAALKVLERPAVRRAVLAYGLLILMLSGVFVVTHRTRLLLPRPFWCETYRGGWQICVHEIFRLPTERLRMIDLGVSIKRPDASSIYTKMQLFTALPRDKVGFTDVPGSWHLLERHYFDKHGWLQRHDERELSSMLDPLVPSHVQIPLWTRIAYDMQARYHRALRLSLPAKLLAVSETYLFLLLVVLVAIWTLLNLLELKLSLLQEADEKAAQLTEPSSV